MIVLKCNECGSVNLEISEKFNITCVDCGYESYNKDNFILFTTKGHTIIDLDNPYWISKDGTKHEFKDMSVEHLKNTINLLSRSYSKKELVNTVTFQGLCQEYMLKTMRE